MNSLSMTIPARFLGAAQAQPQREIVREGDRSVRYGELLVAAANVAARIAAETRRPNVALLLPNGIGYAAGFLGISLAGRTVVPVNFLLKPGEIAGIIADSQVDTIITAGPMAATVAVAGLKTILIEEILATAKPIAVTPPEVAPDDVAVLLYTAGTTAQPKGVMQTHRNILSNIEGCLRAMLVEDRDVFLCLLPLFHTFGLTCTFLLPLLRGNRIVMMQRFVPGAMPETIENHGVSLVVAVPSMFRAMLKAFAEVERKPESLRLCLAGGEALPADLCARFREVSGAELVEGYGMTESSPVISLNRLGSVLPGTVGYPLDNLKVAIMGADGVALGAGTDGEICVRGECVMKGYWNMPEETRSAIDAEGWLHTGDLGRMEASGHLRITGRIKELIISAGKNISPGEIEEVLEKHPAVEEAAVIGIDDRVRGEVPKAFIVLDEHAGEVGAGEIMAHCRECLADYKRPREIVFVKEMPRSMTGKILKRMLKHP